MKLILAILLPWLHFYSSSTLVWSGVFIASADADWGNTRRYLGVSGKSQAQIFSIEEAISLWTLDGTTFEPPPNLVQLMPNRHRQPLPWPYTSTPAR